MNLPLGRRTEKSPAVAERSSKHLFCGLLAEESFIRTLRLERRRTERSRRPFLLMLLDAEKLLQTDKKDGVLEKIASALSESTRETDVSGWYKTNSVAGVLFTEVGPSDKNTILATILAKVRVALRGRLNAEQLQGTQLSFHFFPEVGDQQSSMPPSNPELYPDLFPSGDSRKITPVIKRAIDILGSFSALIIIFPLFVLIALAVKLSSRGLILFRQERVGQYGETFMFLKFRSMYSANDPEAHKEYVKRFISGREECKPSDENHSVIYKIKEDPRVTPVGKFLRKSSLDELPQLWNVLRGDMSLVGPRPPVPYELEAYETWHRRRVFEAKPGMTGLWQVHGRSRTKFDDMVRLDLRYAKKWSLWLDFRILLQTPRAVFSGDGAY